MVHRGSAAAIVLAGGGGTRVGADRNKVYLRLAGRPVITWSLSLFTGVPEIGPVVLVVRDEDRALVDRALVDEVLVAGVDVVTGGATRQASELAGLRHLAGPIGDGTVDVVLIHDGARPLLGRNLVTEVLQVARACGGAVPGLPCADLAAARSGGPGGLSGAPPPGLVAVQTPQAFRAAPLLAAYEEAERSGFAGTDTASCMQRFAPEVSIRAVRGQERNFKITYAYDLLVAEAVLAEDR